MNRRACTKIPAIKLDTEAILLKADTSEDMITYNSTVSGVHYIIDRFGGVMIIDGHNCFRQQWEDLSVICEELRAWILGEAERWQRE